MRLGNGNGAGEENRDVARMASLLAGLPTTVPGVTENRLCGSGARGARRRRRQVAVGDADVVIAGGVESMTRAPWVVAKPDRSFQRTNHEMHSTTLGWRLVNPRHPAEWTVPLGEGAEILTEKFAIGRLVQDALARVVSRAVSGIDPHLYGLGPVEAASRALERTGIGWSDLAVVELDEAFAAQALACLSSWPDLDRSIVNPNGGAIAIGHPIECSGARIATTLVHELRRRGGGYGLAKMCIGVGQGIATVFHAAPDPTPRASAPAEGSPR